MATIRQARLSDLADVEYICRMTAGPVCQKEPITGNRIAKMYSTYYIRECTDTCFVLADDNDRAVGYVLCEPDCRRYQRLYRKIDVPAIWSLKKSSGLVAWCFPVPYRVFGIKYPAHLHIDILDEYQGQGYGTKMVEALLSKLREMKIPGVVLMASGENDGAIRFYGRIGFKMLLHTKKIAAMAIDLTK